MSFAIPTEWPIQSRTQVGDYIRGSALRALILADRYVVATRRPGFAGAWPQKNLSGASGVTVAVLRVWRAAAGAKVELRIWGDDCTVYVDDGTGAANVTIPDGAGTPSYGVATLTVATAGWVTITITADGGSGTGPQSLLGWQLADATLTSGELPA